MHLYYSVKNKYTYMNLVLSPTIAHVKIFFYLQYLYAQRRKGLTDTYKAHRVITLLAKTCMHVFRLA